MFITSIVTVMYYCNIYFIYFTEVSIPTVSVSVIAPSTPMVGQPLLLQCEVTTVRGITSRVDIVWSSDGTVLSRLNGTKVSTVSNSQVYSTMHFVLPLRTSDDGRVIRCKGIIQAASSKSSTNTFTLDITG